MMINQQLKEIYALIVGVQKMKHKKINMLKLILLKKCKLMAEMGKIFLKMPGILKKILNFLILCQMDKRVGESF